MMGLRGCNDCRKTTPCGACGVMDKAILASIKDEELGTPSELAEMKAELELLKDDLAQYQLPMLVIQEDWNNSKCPRCNENFSDYEDCDDGFYHRAYSLNRCPHCGQKITWY